MSRLHWAFTGLCAYLFMAAAITVYVPRPRPEERHHKPAKEVPCRWNSEDELRAAYEGLPERRSETRRKMRERMEGRLAEPFDSTHVETTKSKLYE